MTRARNVKLAVLAAAAALALTGCGLNPGAAAVVGDTTISTDQVDEAASALCSASLEEARAQGQDPDLPSRGARQGAVRLLIDHELSMQFAEQRGITADQGDVSQGMAQFQQILDLVPPVDRPELAEIIRGIVETRVVLVEAGQQSLAASGEVASDPAAAESEGARLRTRWAKSVEVEVDPRYGTFEQGQLRPSSGSMSIPASDGAFEGNKPEPSTEWVASLPATQKCS